MSEANAEDGPLWSWTIKNVKMSEAQYRNRICILISVRPEFPQNKKRSKWKIPPQTPPFPFAISSFRGASFWQFSLHDVTKPSAYFPPFETKGKMGIMGRKGRKRTWIPAFAGMTRE